MSERFKNLTKVPNQPALRLLAAANAKLEHVSALPASAPVAELFAEMEAAAARIDMIRLLTAALPARESIWWACLAARDVIDPEVKPLPRPLQVAEEWVRKPGMEWRKAAREAAEVAEPDDETTLCAVAVAFHDGKLGDGDLAAHDAPPGASAIATFGMNMIALNARSDAFEAVADVLIDRGLDIARGGNGRLPLPPRVPEPAEGEDA